MKISALTLRGDRDSPLTFVSRVLVKVHGDQVIRLRDPAPISGWWVRGGTGLT